MSTEKSQQEKVRLHARNKNRDRYDLAALIAVKPELAEYVTPNRYGEDSVDFTNPVAVKLLNQALLNHYYGIENWDFPNDNLCPPIPGRADYIHYMADLLAENNFGNIPTGKQITFLDIGVGASCIYPIIGRVEYGWSFIGSDIDSTSIESAKNIINSNELLKGHVECRLQKHSKDCFYGVIGKEEKVDVSICNPPFHASKEEAERGTRRKVKNLTGENKKNPSLNFSGMTNEIICEGGEHKFIHDMIRESKKFEKNCMYFSTLVSKQSNLKGIYNALENNGAKQIKTIPIGTGNKSSRIVVWSYLSKEEKKEWSAERWEG